MQYKDTEMSHFAQIDSNNTVIQVLVIEQDVIDTGIFGPKESWIQTSYNTKSGIHTLGGIPLRKNYAAIGYTYDPVLDAFIPPKPGENFVLNTTTAQWEEVK
jgi:hypothetical protein